MDFKVWFGIASVMLFMSCVSSCTDVFLQWIIIEQFVGTNTIDGGTLSGVHIMVGVSGCFPPRLRVRRGWLDVDLRGYVVADVWGCFVARADTFCAGGPLPAVAWVGLALVLVGGVTRTLPSYMTTQFVSNGLHLIRHFTVLFWRYRI